MKEGEEEEQEKEGEEDEGQEEEGGKEREEEAAVTNSTFCDPKFEALIHCECYSPWPRVPVRIFWAIAKLISLGNLQGRGVGRRCLAWPQIIFLRCYSILCYPELLKLLGSEKLSLHLSLLLSGTDYMFGSHVIIFTTQ